MSLTRIPGSFLANNNVTFANGTFTNANLGNLATANFINGTLQTNAQLNITSVGTLANLSVSGNISGNNFIVNSTLASTSKTTGAVTVAGGVGISNDLTVGNSITVNNGSYGNVVITQFGSVFAHGSGPNPRAIYQATAADGITGVGMQAYSGLNGQIYANTGLIFTTGATIRDKDFPTGGTTRAIIDSSGLTVTGIANVSGNITSLNANLGNLVTANFFTGNGSLLTEITGANVTGQVGNALVSSTVYTASQPNITSVGTLTSLDVTGNVTSGNSNLGNLATANFFTGNGSLLTAITGGNVTGTVANATYAANAGNATIAESATTSGTVTTASQPNITSLGTLSALTITGNANVGNLGVTTDLLIGGNLIVNGTTTTVNSTTTSVVDPIIELGGGSNGAVLSSSDSKDRGQLLHYYSGSAIDAFMGWDSSNAEFAFGSNVSVTSDVVTFNSFGNTRAGNANLGNLATANFFTGNGSLLTEITGANVTGQVANALVAGTVYTAAQPNITSVGTLSSLSVTSNILSGNANLGNLATANFFTGNGSLLSALNLSNITAFSTSGLTIDELYLQSTTRLNVTASGTSGYIFDQYGAATVNPAIYVTSGQTLSFNLSVTGHPFLIQTGAGANYDTGLEHVDTTGTVSSASSAQGQIAGTLYWKIPYGITGNYKYQCSIHGGMNGNIVVSDANVSNLTVGSATTATTAGTVTTASQPNITSVGTLSGLTSNGIINFTDTSNVSLGAVGNVKITGGTTGYVLSTDGAGNLSWAAQSGGTGASISNGTSNVNVASSGNITIGVSGNASIVTVTGTGANIAGYADVTGNLNVGAISNLGPIGNVKITGGTSGYVLSTDGSGTLSWVAQSGGGGGSGYTAATTPPGSSNPGDLWYNTSTNVLYEYIFDGTSSYWVDMTTPTTSAAITTTYVTRSYTGDGSTTNYTVTLGCDVNNILVFLNGICQMPTTDYTVSGTVLTLIPAADSGMSIQVRELPR